MTKPTINQYEYHSRTINTKVDSNELTLIVILLPENAEIVGVASVELEADTAWLKEVFVCEAFRGNGIAKMICIQAIEIASTRQKKAIALRVRKDNDAAYQLYTKLGFTIGLDCKDGYWMMSLETTREMAEIVKHINKPF